MSPNQQSAFITNQETFHGVLKRANHAVDCLCTCSELSTAQSGYRVPYYSDVDCNQIVLIVLQGSCFCCHSPAICRTFKCTVHSDILRKKNPSAKELIFMQACIGHSRRNVLSQESQHEEAHEVILGIVSERHRPNKEYRAYMTPGVPRTQGPRALHSI